MRKRKTVAGDDVRIVPRTESLSPLPSDIWNELAKGTAYKAGIGLYSVTAMNENFFIGRQWEGLSVTGLPTPVFNFIKRAVMYTVASLMADGGTADNPPHTVDLVSVVRDLLRNAAVDGDCAAYVYRDAQGVKTEVIENDRVFFGNTASADVQSQPYIIIASREYVSGLPVKAEDFAEGDISEDGKTTVLLRFWKNAETGTVFAAESVRGAFIRPPWDTGLTLYPLIWMQWDKVRGSYHGEAMVTPLVANQIFVNKLFAMSMISLMHAAFPKVVYDRLRVASWDNRAGAAIGVAGDIDNVATIIEPAQISPQISQFIDKTITYTQSLLGATPAALGETDPDNTSAILALQKAANIQNDLTRYALAEQLRNLGKIYTDMKIEN